MESPLFDNVAHATAMKTTFMIEMQLKIKFSIM